MSDTAFVLGMAAIVAFGLGVPAYVRYKDARDEARIWREVMFGPPRCLRGDCHNPVVEGKVNCAECIAEMRQKGIEA